MTPNAFKRGMAEGRVQYGLWNSLCSAIAADVVADVGFDWLLMDMEHAPNDLGTVMLQLQAAVPYGSTALVRPMGFDPVLVKRLLDIGAPGLLFPMVNSVDEAKEVVSACRYPPKGIRGVSHTMRGNRYGRDPLYGEQVEAETCILVQAETLQALDQVAEIAAVDGVDGVFFGPADIAASMGMFGKITDDAVWQRIFEAARAVQAVGKPCGTLVGTPELTKRVVDEGFLFVAIGGDHGLLARAAEALLARARG